MGAKKEKGGKPLEVTEEIVEEDDDAQYYREEVGQEPDAGTAIIVCSLFI